MVTRVHRLPLNYLIKTLRADLRNGLDEREVALRREKYGFNVLEKRKKKSAFMRFLEQFKNVLIVILIVTAIISFFIPGHYYDGYVILLVVFLNASMGFYMEYKAEMALEALKKLSAPTCKVKRGGKVKSISSTELVPGDIIYLEAGMKVPADARLISTERLKVDESNLTGESYPVGKVAKDIRHEVPLAERVNMVYMGTIITEGKGWGLVTSVGMSTELGQIARMVSGTGDKRTPLQEKIDQLGNRIGLFAGIVAVFVFFFLFVMHPNDPFTPLLTAVSLAVAVIPEGLPVVMALTLTIGMLVMARKNAIVRRLASVETLGATTVICTDKTGTLTKNEMTVRVVVTADGKRYSVSGVGYEPEGSFKHRGRVVVPWTHPGLRYTLISASLCTNARHWRSGRKWKTLGDPTEIALITLAKKAGINKEWCLQNFPRLGEIVFDEERMMMTTVHEYRLGNGKNGTLDGRSIHTERGGGRGGSVGADVGPDSRSLGVDLGLKPGQYVGFYKGAPEMMIEKCTHIFKNGKIRKLTLRQKKAIIKENRHLASKGYRVLAIGYRPIPKELMAPIYEDVHLDKTVDSKSLQEEIESNIVFLGLVGMIDPPRPRVKDAIDTAKKAGMRVVMITGDQKDTAIAVGRELGLYKRGDLVITGHELTKMSDQEFERIAHKVTIFARSSPAQKLRIVETLQAKGEVVGMTGDGVNDAPALSKADIGIAMGKSGTDVAKDASDMILADDNFVTIVKAVEEGRRIYSNIKKFVKYQISTNIGAILLIVISALIGLGIPLFPVQILWINILMDGPPAVSLGFEPLTKDMMEQPPRRKDEAIMNLSMVLSIIASGIVMALGTLYLYRYGMLTAGVDKARTLAFSAFVFFQLINVLNCRSETKSIIELKPGSNKMLIYSITALALIQVAIVSLPFTHAFFHTVPLDLKEWFLVISVALSIFIFDEFRKLYAREIRKGIG